MELRGPSVCELAETMEYFLTFIEEGFTLQILDSEDRIVKANIEDTEDPSVKRVCIVPEKIGKYSFTVFGEPKRDNLQRKECFCYNLDAEKWYFDEIHGSLEDVHLEMEVSFHRPIIDYITAQAHLVNKNLEKGEDSKVIQCKATYTSTMNLDFFFKPFKFGTYRINLFCGQESVRKPRFLIQVVDFSKFKLVHSLTSEKCLLSLKQKVSFIFDLSGAPSNYLKAWIEGPDKNRADMLLYGEEKQEKIGQLRCDFVPASTGKHSLLAYYGEIIFEKCPLDFHVFNEKMVKIVEAIPPLTSRFVVDDPLTLTYDCSLCGLGSLEISALVHLNSGASYTIPVEKRGPNGAGIVKTTIKCALQGNYVITAFFNNELAKQVLVELTVHPSIDKSTSKTPSNSAHGTEAPALTRARTEITETPIKVTMKSKLNEDKKMVEGVVQEDIPNVFGEGLLHAEIGKVALFTVDPQNKPGQLLIDIKGPRSLAKCLIRPDPVSGSYKVEYYPNEVGLYIITILWNNKMILNNPFHVFVTDIKKIRCLNFPEIFDETLSLLKDKRIQLDFDYSEAGNGRFSAIMKRGNTETKLRCWSDTSKKIWSFFVKSDSDEDFVVNVFWNEIFLGTIKTKCDIDSGEAAFNTGEQTLKIVLRGRGINEAWIEEEGEFIAVVLNGGDGILHVNLNRADNPGDIIPVDINQNIKGEYRCSYKPKTVGDYLLNIAWGKKTVIGSPFQLKIRSRKLSQKIPSQRDGLYQGFVGEETFVDINIDRPLEDESLLSVFCLGPLGNPVKCDLTQKSITHYQIKVVAQTQGQHQLNVLYCNTPIPGSPFYQFFSNPANISEIIVSGPGLLSTSLDEVDSRFTVNTRGAGTGKLTIQVKGPQESFHVEVQKDPDDERLIKCSYNPKSVGIYTITVSWNGILTLNSPFTIVLS